MHVRYCRVSHTLGIGTQGEITTIRIALRPAPPVEGYVPGWVSVLAPEHVVQNDACIVE